MRFRRATGGRGAPGRLVAIGALAAALAALGRALWLRAAARRFARVRGPRFAAAVEGPRLALPAGAADDDAPGAPPSDAAASDDQDAGGRP